MFTQFCKNIVPNYTSAMLKYLVFHSEAFNSYKI